MFMISKWKMNTLWDRLNQVVIPETEYLYVIENFYISNEMKRKLKIEVRTSEDLFPYARQQIHWSYK